MRFRPIASPRVPGLLLTIAAAAGSTGGAAETPVAAPLDLTAPVVANAPVRPPCSVGAPVAAPAGPMFDILEFRIEGNTLFTRAQLEAGVAACMGEGKTLADVEAARTRLEAAYHAAGWLTVQVDIPEQAVSSGVVTLNVVESPVGRVRVTGSRYYTHGMIRATVPSLDEGRIPNFNAVQTELAQLNRTEARRVTPLLRASDTPGMVDVELQVTDRSPLRGGIEVNNRQSSGTSPTRVLGYLRYDNLFQRDHSMTLQYVIAPENVGDVRALSVAYTIPTASGPVWAFYAVRAKSDIAVFSNLNVIGNGKVFGARRVQPLPARESFFHSYTLGIDYKDFGEELRLAGLGAFPRPVTSVPMSAQYNATWRAGPGAGGDATSLEVGAHVLVRGFGSDQKEFATRRAGAEPTYLVLRGSLEQARTLTPRAGLVTRGSMQVASDPLVAAEQFNAGGADTVRGYREVECLADLGARGSVEARTPIGGTMADAAETPSMLRTFFDAAWLDTLQPLPGQRDRCALASVGIGLRHAVRGVRIDLDLARALHSTNNTQSGDYRLHVRANYDF